MDVSADSVDGDNCCQEVDCPRRKLERLGIDPFINGLRRDYILSRASLEELRVTSLSFWKLLSALQSEYCEIYTFLLLRMRCLLGDAKRILSHLDFFTLLDDSRLRRDILVMVLKYYRGMRPANKKCRICDSPILHMYHEVYLYEDDDLAVVLDFMTNKQIRRTRKTLLLLYQRGLNPLHKNSVYCCKKHLNYFNQALQRKERKHIRSLDATLKRYLTTSCPFGEKSLLHNLLYLVKGDTSLLKQNVSYEIYKKVEYLFPYFVHHEDSLPQLTGNTDLKICCQILKCLEWKNLK